MARKRYKPEEIRQIGVSEVTCYRWRQDFGWLKIEQVKRHSAAFCGSTQERLTQAAVVEW
jgi:hypothetical protein